MSMLKKPAVWRNAESAILPVVTRLFREGDLIPAHRPNKVFRYDGTREYVGAGDYAGLRTRVILLASPDAQKAPAELFPIAMGPLMRRISETPEAFTGGGLARAVQSTLEDAGLPHGVFPSFHTNESYYYAFCREVLSRIVPPTTAEQRPLITTDERGVAWVRDTQVKALEIAASHIAHGWSAEEIRRQHPGLELAAIYAALAWYYEHQQACDARLASDLDLAERLRKQTAESPLQARVRRAGRAA